MYVKRMVNSDKKIGEHSSVAEELLLNITELELKCKAVEKSVKEGYFTLNEALTNYNVSEQNYNNYKSKTIRRKSKNLIKSDIIDLLYHEKFDKNELIDIYNYLKNKTK